MSKFNELSDLVNQGYSTLDAEKLYDVAYNEVYEENKHMLRFASYADKWAKTLSIPSAAIDAVTIGGIFGVLPAMGMDFLKKMPKIGFIAYYGAKSRDVVGTLGNIMYETASLLPFAGEFLDFKERYAGKVKNYIQKQVTEKLKQMTTSDLELKAA